MTETLVAPARTIEQRRAALERANYVRFRRADLKRLVKEVPVRGGTWMIVLVDNPPDWFEGMRLAEILLALPTIGRVKQQQLFRQWRISERATVGGLTDRQREEVLAWLRSR